MYVEAYSGSDTVGTGEKNSPVASLAKALEIAGEVDFEENNGVEIIVGGGTYYLDSAISVTAKNHKTDKLVIRAADGETPTFVNGVTFKMKDAVKVDDTEIISRLTNPGAADHLYVLDLTSKVAVADIPGVHLPGAYSYESSWITESKTPTCEMFYNGKAMTVARYPNADAVNPYSVVSAVVHEGAIPRNGDTDSTDVFVIASDKANSWTQADQALMFGYWKHDWATQTVPLAKAENGNLTAKYPSHYGVSAGQRYYVYNLLEEIDTEGEYFIDRTDGKMYFYKQADTTDDSEITMSLSDDYMLKITADNTVVDGLSFTASREDAIRIRANDVTVKNCKITNTAGLAVDVDGTNNVVENCTIKYVDGGIYVNGGDTTTFTDANNKIINNDISNFARLSKTYTFAIRIWGSGSTASHNKLYDSEHTALTLAGTNHTVSYNEIHDVCKEVDDSGAIYMGRTWVDRGNKIVNNYIHTIKSNAIDTGDSSVAGIFVDDHYADAYIAGNVFADIGGHGVRTNLGRENTITNNIFVGCTDGSVIISSTNNPVASDYSSQKSKAEAFLAYDKWNEEYPILFTTNDEGIRIVNMDELIYGNNNVCTKNLSVNCGANVTVGAYAKANGTVGNNKAQATDPGFANMAAGDYTIDDSVMQTLIPGFVNVEFNKMGKK